MPALAHLNALKAKHRALEVQLSEALVHPSTSDWEIAELKQQKLLLKDQISALEASLRSAFA